MLKYLMPPVYFGLTKIAKKFNLSTKTLLKFHRKYGFPIKKLGRRWISTPDALYEWGQQHLDILNEALKRSKEIKQGLLRSQK